MANAVAFWTVTILPKIENSLNIIKRDTVKTSLITAIKLYRDRKTIIHRLLSV